MSNYDNLLRKKEQELSMPNDKMEQHWAAMAGLLDTGDGNIKIQKPKAKLVKMAKLFLGAVFLSVIGYIGYKQVTKKSAHHNNSQEAILSKVIPPMKGMDIPYETYTMDAAKGDTIYTNNGSILIFPQNAVLNEDGSAVTGNIEIKSREFNDPIDYAFAGIPMIYDSAGKQYTFISSAMIDINAFQNGQKLKVNPKAKPILHLVSTNDNLNTNLYRLNTITGEWVNKGKDVVTNVIQMGKPQSVTIPAKNSTSFTSDYQQIRNDGIVFAEPSNDFAEEAEDKALPQKPEPPIKATGKNPVIEIQIDPASFKELLVYNNMKFEVIGGDKWDPKDSEIEWQDVKLQTITPGKVYRITFTKHLPKQMEEVRDRFRDTVSRQKIVSYSVNPVLEGKDFEKAQKEYDAKLAEYDRQIMQKKNEMDSVRKITNELKPFRNDSIVPPAAYNGMWMMKDSLKTNGATTFKLDESAHLNTSRFATSRLMSNKMAELERLVALRNEEIDKRNKEIEAENKRIIEQMERNRQFVDSMIKVQDSINQRQIKMYELQQNMIRSFEIDGFGYWNCDQPTIPGGTIFVGSFKDDQGKEFTYNYMNAASYGINRVLAYYNNTITVVPNAKHCMWSFRNGDLYYIGFDDYEKLNITSATKNVNIPLRKYSGTATSIDALKKEIFYVKNNKSNQ